jgi:molybdate transport system substrate-binding protein
MAPRGGGPAQCDDMPTRRPAFACPALLAAATAITATLAACGSAESAGRNPAQSITVFAAASTARVMQQEIDAYTNQHPGEHVAGDYEGTQALLVKLEADPSSADVFLSADRAHMSTAQSRGLVGSPHDLAANRLVIAVPPGNPAHVTGLADLARPGIRLDLADHSVPAGAYAEQALRTAESRGDAPAGFATAALGNVVSRETDVEQVVAKVAAGVVDAGVVYATDAVANAQRITAVAIPAADQPATVYPIAVTAHAPDAAAAQAFVQFLLGRQGQQILRAAGFTSP